MRKSDGSIDYLVGVVEDITARKKAEEELRKSEERFRSSVLLSPLPTLLYDDREQILALSQSWLEGSSYAADELRRTSRTGRLALTVNAPAKCWSTSAG